MIYFQFKNQRRLFNSSGNITLYSLILEISFILSSIISFSNDFFQGTYRAFHGFG